MQAESLALPLSQLTRTAESEAKYLSKAEEKEATYMFVTRGQVPKIETSQMQDVPTYVSAVRTQNCFIHTETLLSSVITDDSTRR